MGGLACTIKSKGSAMEWRGCSQYHGIQLMITPDTTTHTPTLPASRPSNPTDLDLPTRPSKPVHTVYGRIITMGNHAPLLSDLAYSNVVASTMLYVWRDGRHGVA